MAGDTAMDEPLTAPAQGAIERLGVGFPETDQESVAVPPLLIVDGDATKSEMLGATSGAWVVALIAADWAETFPAASNAATE